MRRDRASDYQARPQIYSNLHDVTDEERERINTSLTQEETLRAIKFWRDIQGDTFLSELVRLLGAKGIVNRKTMADSSFTISTDPC